MNKVKVPRYRTATEVADLLNVTRQAVADIAKREGWQVSKIGTAHLYPVADVLAYRDIKRRTELVRELGWRGVGSTLYRVADVDTVCEECGAFAVMWPATPHVAEFTFCLSGHKIGYV